MHLATSPYALSLIILEGESLIGIDVDKYITKAAQQGKLFFGAEEEVKEEYLRKIRTDIETSNYRKDIEDGMYLMVQDLLDKKLEITRSSFQKDSCKDICAISR